MTNCHFLFPGQYRQASCALLCTQTATCRHMNNCHLFIPGQYRQASCTLLCTQTATCRLFFCSFQVNIDRHPVRFFVHKRPHVDYFLFIPGQYRQASCALLCTQTATCRLFFVHSRSIQTGILCASLYTNGHMQTIFSFQVNIDRHPVRFFVHKRPHVDYFFIPGQYRQASCALLCTQTATCRLFFVHSRSIQTGILCASLYTNGHMQTIFSFQVNIDRHPVRFFVHKRPHVDYFFIPGQYRQASCALLCTQTATCRLFFVHSRSIQTGILCASLYTNGHMQTIFSFQVNIDRHPVRFFVHKRPHVDYFLIPGQYRQASCALLCTQTATCRLFFVHSRSIQTGILCASLYTNGHMQTIFSFQVNIDRHPVRFFVHKRPHVDYFSFQVNIDRHPVRFFVHKRPHVDYFLIPGQYRQASCALLCTQTATCRLFFVHSRSIQTGILCASLYTNGHMQTIFSFKVNIDRHPVRFFVHKRPHVDYFLFIPGEYRQASCALLCTQTATCRLFFHSRSIQTGILYASLYTNGHMQTIFSFQVNIDRHPVRFFVHKRPHVDYFFIPGQYRQASCTLLCTQTATCRLFFHSRSIQTGILCASLYTNGHMQTIFSFQVNIDRHPVRFFVHKRPHVDYFFIPGQYRQASCALLCTQTATCRLFFVHSRSIQTGILCASLYTNGHMQTIFLFIPGQYRQASCALLCTQTATCRLFFCSFQVNIDRHPVRFFVHKRPHVDYFFVHSRSIQTGILCASLYTNGHMQTIFCSFQVNIDRHPVRFFVHKRPHVDYFFVHSRSIQTGILYASLYTNGHMQTIFCSFQVNIDRHPVRFFVHKRPHVDYFLFIPGQYRQASCALLCTQTATCRLFFVHSRSIQTGILCASLYTNGHMQTIFSFQVNIDRHPVRFFVHKRPHVDYFLFIPGQYRQASCALLCTQTATCRLFFVHSRSIQTGILCASLYTNGHMQTIFQKL